MDDQKRIATPKFAFENGANFIVMGRPITQSDHPVEFFENILKGGQADRSVKS